MGVPLLRNRSLVDVKPWDGEVLVHETGSSLRCGFSPLFGVKDLRTSLDMEPGSFDFETVYLRRYWRTDSGPPQDREPLVHEVGSSFRYGFDRLVGTCESWTWLIRVH